MNISDINNELHKREFTDEGVSRIDTINNIGSIMGERINKGVKKSLLKMDRMPNGAENDFTPIAYPTLQLAEELGIKPALFDSFKEMAAATGGEKEPKKGFNHRSNCIGDAWVVNPPFQFNENDDVRSNLSFPHFGRVFNEKINANYPIAVFEVGRIKFNQNIFSGTQLDGDNIHDTKMAKRIRGGDGNLLSIIGAPVALIATVLKTSWNVLTTPIKYLLGLKKFATFQPDTRLFEEYFNDLAQSIAATLGLLEPLDISSVDGNNPDFENEESFLNMPYDETSQGAYAGLRRRLTLRSILPGGMGEAESDYIPFLVGKDVSISESISNNTQSNPMAANLNSTAAQNAADKLNNYNSDIGEQDLINNIKDRLKRTVNLTKNSFFKGDLSTVISGDGRVSLPDMWSDSNFSRSVSMNFTFNSPYGHKLSIFENAYIPFLLLFCMALPRQVGSRTFTNPFFVRVNMKGRFSIPMGIIESLTIERGEDKNNWTIENLPKTIKCSVSIKDLSPVLMMGMMKGKFMPLFVGNDGFSAYINTLGGLSIKDQKDFGARFKRWWDRVKERAESRGKTGTLEILADQLNPFAYVEPLVRSKMSGGFIGRRLIKLRQSGILNALNPDEDTRTDIY